MNVVINSNACRKACVITLTSPWVLLGLFSLLLLFSSSLLYVGYWAGQPTDSKVAVSTVSEEWRSDVSRQQQELEALRTSMSEHMDALAIKLGDAQAQVIRLNALGKRLTKIANLDEGEFDFEAPPALGGPFSPSAKGESLASADFIQLLSELEQQIDDREQQLTVMETLLMSRSLQKEVFPAGRPIEKGWLSSRFGMRTDPFSGKQERHKGLDFAGKMGSNVVAVASGVVTWSGKRSGYGQMVEINHGGGYVTRYGHSKENLVEAGDSVDQGQVIALMGSSGRSTGPHVHFEVLRNGREVDPSKYIKAAR